MPRLHKFSDPPELLVVHLIGQNVRGDGNPLQSRAHHRDIRRRRDEHLHGKQGKGEGHDQRCRIFEALQQATPFGAGETFHGRVKENPPRLFGDNDRPEGSELGHGVERID